MKEYMFLLEFIENDTLQATCFCTELPDDLSEEEMTSSAKEHFYNSDACRFITNVQSFTYIGPSGF